MRTIAFRVWGPAACFTMPESKAERVSYPALTPSAARNICHAICGRPEMRWVIRQIRILRPVRWLSIRRNEVTSTPGLRAIAGWIERPASEPWQRAGAGGAEATLRHTLALSDVAYCIEAYPLVKHPTSSDHALKYAAMFTRRLARGQCFARPYLGCREFACHFGPLRPDDVAIPQSFPIGRMLYDIIFSPAGNRPVFFDARVESGVLDTDPRRAIPDPDLRYALLRCS